MLSLKKIYTLATIAFTGLSLSATAQVFTTPTAVQNIYPTGAAVQKPTTASAYSLGNMSSAWGTADFYVSGWSGANNGFIWRFTKPGLPNSIFGQGVFPYANVIDMEVGIVNGPSGIIVTVAYYKVNSGHYVDIYKVTSSTSTPLVFAGTITLSNSLQYGRIRIDSHKMYGTAIVWCYPGVGIQTIVANNGTFSSVVTLNGTATSSDPDVAFSHSSGDLNVHYAYHDKPAGKIIESVVPWPALLTSPPPSISPLIEDVNPVGTGSELRLVLDCPDHYDVENWAYSYNADGLKIAVRFIDYHTTAIPTTAIVNDGSLGNYPLAGIYKAFYTALYYGDGNSGDQIHVGWYTTNGSPFNGYVSVQMKESGAGLISNLDYMRMPVASSTPGTYPIRTGIAYAKGSDVGLIPNFLYAVYYDLPGSTYRFTHAFHKWGMLVFRGTASHPDCGPATSNVLSAAQQGAISVYPNPFTDVVTTAFYASRQGTAKLQLLDMTGKMLAQTSDEVTVGNHTFSTSSLQHLPAGTYLLSITLNGESIATQKVSKY